MNKAPHYLFITPVLGMASFLCQQVVAQTSPPSSISEVTDVVVVTGTMSNKLLEHSPVPISVIDSQDISEKAATKLTHVLSSVPGLQLSKQHGQQGQTVMMQGMQSKHVLVLIDGVPVSQSGNNINLERLMLSNIDRVEIVPGASSALYGSSAMGGVINLITKTGEKDYQTYQMTVAQAEENTQQLPTESVFSAGLGSQFLSGYSDTSLNFTSYSGNDLDPETWSEEVAEGYRWALNQSFKFDQAQIKFDWTGGRLNRNFTEEKAGREFDQIKYENSDEIDLSAKYQASSGGIYLIQQGFDYYETLQDFPTTSGNDFTRVAQSTNSRASGTWSNEFGMRTLTYGTVAYGEFLSQEKTDTGVVETEVPDRRRSGVELFIQDDWFVRNELEIISGMRSEWNSKYGWHISPKISARWDVEESVYIRTSIGSGYRSPNLKEQYYLFDHSHLGYIIIGNEELEPEESINIQSDIGGQFSNFTHELNWTLGVFQQDVTNLIDIFEESVDNEGLETYTYDNIGQALIRGANVDLSLNSYVGDHKLNLSWGYTYLDAKDVETDLRLERRSEHQNKLNARLSLSTGFKPVLGLQLNQQTDQLTDREEGTKAEGFTTLDFNSQCSLNQNFKFNFNILNITDVVKNPIIDDDVRPIQGRTWKVGITFNN